MNKLNILAQISSALTFEHFIHRLSVSFKSLYKWINLQLVNQLVQFKIRTMGGENPSDIKCIKITLTVLYILSLIGTILLVIFAIVGLVAVANTEAKDAEDRNNLKIAKDLLIVGIVLGLIAVFLSAVALYGVIKEIKWIIIALTVLGVLSSISYVVTGAIFSAIWTIFVTILTGLYAKKLHDKQLMDPSMS